MWKFIVGGIVLFVLILLGTAGHSIINGYE